MIFKNFDIFVARMEKLGVKLELSSNYPWVYLDKVNGNTVDDKFRSDHYFTIGFMPIRFNGEFKFTDLNEIFKVIRKYR